MTSLGKPRIHVRSRSVLRRFTKGFRSIRPPIPVNPAPNSGNFRKSGRIESESVAAFDWNRWPDSIGIDGRISPEYAKIASRQQGGSVLTAVTNPNLTQNHKNLLLGKELFFLFCGSGSVNQRTSLSEKNCINLSERHRSGTSNTPTSNQTP